ncbi:uncharacterized protein J8A68_002144 [[Candida] subhashii]|uniref:Zn(2)-C6 fungal-type domain-containing protein n=1 Tax=[Candida] subhashii TaxID=561895 RepID=A0A8J5UYH2_9ASCO|nr:uncharacterized protein J8A68_002144 [[Candida] subhashii]KAG7664325.1 hypothetical protein J8A68_002144 [[Candida] subhashii]
MDSSSIERTKVSRACDYCKKRKFKCSGITPCDLCLKKSIECTFSIIDRRTIRRKNKKRTTKNNITKNKISKDDTIIDKHILKILSKKNNIPKHYQPLLTFPLHKVDATTTKDEDEDEDEHEGIDEDRQDHEEILNNNPVSKHNPAAALCNDGDNGICEDGTLEEEDDSNNQPEDSKDSIPKPKNPTQKELDALLAGTTKQSSSSSKQREPPRVLYDSTGNLRYFGESSPLAFLFECRKIFSDRIGESAFTSNQSNVEITDIPDESSDAIQVELPTRDICDYLVNIFFMNISQACYLFDMNHFVLNVVDFVYDNKHPDSSATSPPPPEKIALLYLVIGLGLTYAELSSDDIIQQIPNPTIMTGKAYFEFGMYLTKKHMNNGRLWITEACIIAFYYYQSVQQRNTAWLMLGMAIRNAQALGLHRKFINESFRDQGYIRHRRKLFKSLYVNDRIASILVGRPLIIDDYDWDDFDNEDIYEYDTSGKPIKYQRITCLIEATKIARLNGKIVRNFYVDGILNPYKAEKLAIESKILSLNLPRSIQIDQVVENNLVPNTNNEQLIRDTKIPLLLVHLSQLYGIVLLCRPFFMYLVFHKKKKKAFTKKPKSRQDIALCNFCKATVKSSSLVIQLIDYYIGYIRFLPQRVESNGIIHCCLMAALVIGLSILYFELNQYTEEEGYSARKQMEYLNSAKMVFEFYSKSNPISKRFYIIVDDMQKALMERFELDLNGNKLSMVPPTAPTFTTTTTNTSPTTANTSVTTTIPEQQPPVAPPIIAAPIPTQPVQPQFDPLLKQQPQPNFIPPPPPPHPIPFHAAHDQHDYVTFNEDYDNFIDSFGALLPMATMSQSINPKIPLMINHHHHQHHQFQSYSNPNSSSSPTTSDSSREGQIVNNGGNGSGNGSGTVKREPLDMFMYSVGVNDVLYDGHV